MSLPKRLRIYTLLSLLLSLTRGARAGSHGSRPDSDRQIIGRAKRVAAGASVELYEDGVHVDPAFLDTLEDGYRRIGQTLGLPFDTATLGPRLLVYVTDADVVSHVWNGYEHPRDPRGIVILNRMAYQGALRGTNATFIHEMTHLFTWRFSSHSLREGLADHVALTLFPGTAVGPNARGYEGEGERAGAIPAEVREVLGTTAAPPGWVRTDRRLRKLYYMASYRLVSRLIEQGGLPKFLRLYASPDPEAAFVQLYGSTREMLVRSL